jgi:integrase
MITYHFYIEKRKVADTSGSLRCRIFDGGKLLLKISLGYQIDVDKWNADAELAKPSTTHGRKKVTAYTINSAIRRYREALDETIVDLRHEAVTADKIRSGLDRFFNPEGLKVDTLLADAFNHYTEAMRPHWSASTHRRVKGALSFLTRVKRAPKLAEIDDKYIADAVAASLDAGHNNNHIKKQCSCIRTFLKFARRQGWQVADTDCRPKLKTISDANRQIIYLSWDELMALYNYNFAAAYLRQARDVFCFCAFTSLRYSDVAQLTRADIFDDALHIVTRKTTDCVTIELNKFSRAILSLYEGYAFPNDKALPVVSSQKYNEYLHEACRLAGIDSPTKTSKMVGQQRIDLYRPKYDVITSHAARRTFVVHALRLGIPAEVVMKWTGHSDYKAMQPYIDIVDDLRRKNMAKFDTAE